MSFERIRKIENTMNSGETIVKERSIIHDVNNPKVIDNWQEDLQVQTPTLSDQPTSQNNWFKRFFFLSVLFAFFGAVFLGVSFFFGAQNISEKNVVTTIATTSSIPGGESFPVTVTIINKNKAPIEYVRITLEYPQTPGGPLDGLSQEKTIDSIPSGEIRDVPFSVTLYGGEQTTRNIKARISYRVPGSVALFESISDKQLTLTSSPMRLALNIPETVFPNQEIVFTVNYTSNLPSTSPASMLKIDYPEQFHFVSAEPKPDIQNNIWKVGSLIPGEDHMISIRGRVKGILGSTIPFMGTIGSFSSVDTNAFESIYTTYITQLGIREPFIIANINVSGATRYAEQLVIQPMSDNDVTIRWQNTQNTSLSNVKISAQLFGNLFNPEIVSAGSGFFDDATNTITWTADESPVLRNITAKADGEVQFSLKDISSLDKNNIPIIQPLLNILVSVEGFTPEGKKVSIQGVTSEIVTLATQPSLTSKLIAGNTPIKNTGTYPPRVSQESTYTIHWKLANTTSDVADATVSAVLPQWVNYTSSISPQSATGFINYNPVNRTVTWKPGTLARGSGYNLRSPEVFFQVRIKPTSSQVGTSPVLVQTPVFRGVDTVTKSEITFTGMALGTSDTHDDLLDGTVKR